MYYLWAVIFVVVHNFGLTEKASTQSESVSSLPLVANQNWSNHSFAAGGGATVDPQYTGCPSQQGSRTFGPYQATVEIYDVEPRQSSLALWALPQNGQSHPVLLPGMRELVGVSSRPHLCPATERTMGPILDLERLGGDSCQGNTTRCWPRSIETKIIISAPEDAERKRKRKRQQDGRKRCRLSQGAQQAPLQSALSTSTLDCRWRSRCSSGDVLYHSGCDIQLRSHHSSSEALSRPCTDAIRVEVGSGKDGGADQSSGDKRPAYSYVSVRPCQKVPCRGEGSTWSASKSVVCFLGRMCQHLARTAKSLCRSRAGAEIPGREGKARDCHHHQSDPTAHKQECDRQRLGSCEHLRPSSASTGNSRNHGRRFGGKTIEAYSPECTRSMSGNSQRRERGHCGRLRGGRRSCWEASAIRGASQNRPRITATLWWCTHYLVSQGSAGRCLMNHLRVPKQVSFESEVEAYHSNRECGAACRHFDIATLKSVDPTQQWLHSVCREHNYSNPYAAVLQAIEARFQVCFPDLDTMKPQSHDDEPYSPTQLRTTDELQEAIVLRSTSQEEDNIEHITAVEPVEALLIIEDWEELRIILRDQSENPPEEMVVVMYGLYQAHVGERRASSQKDIHAVRECVFRTWDDFLLPGVTAFLHLVRPQEHLQFKRSTLSSNSAVLWSHCRTLACHHCAGQSGTVLEQIIQLWSLLIIPQAQIVLSCCEALGCLSGADLTAEPRVVYSSKRLCCHPWHWLESNKDRWSRFLSMTSLTVMLFRRCKLAPP